MAYKDYKESTRRAIDKYDAKTYKRLMLRLRVEDDADIIASWEKARAEGMKTREWIRTLYGGGNGE